MFHLTMEMSKNRRWKNRVLFDKQAFTSSVPREGANNMYTYRTYLRWLPT